MSCNNLSLSFSLSLSHGRPLAHSLPLTTSPPHPTPPPLQASSPCLSISSLSRVLTVFLSLFLSVSVQWGKQTNSGPAKG